MERRTPHGIYYSNETLGIKESAHQLNAHFYPEGEEKKVTAWGEPAVEIGYLDTISPYYPDSDRRIVIFEHSPHCPVQVHTSKVCPK